MISSGVSQLENFSIYFDNGDEGEKKDESEISEEEYKKQELAESEQMAEFYPSYLKEKQEGNVTLTDKALKILRLQAEGLSVEAIAKQLDLSKAGVKYYNQETYKKLGVKIKDRFILYNLSFYLYI